MSDCMSLPAREPIFHHIGRALHNLFHPHQHIAAPVHVAPAAQVCAAPELAEVTVAADMPTEPPPGLADAPLSSPGSLGAPIGLVPLPHYSTVVGSALGCSTCVHVAPAPCPAPELNASGAVSAALLLAGVLAILIDRRV